MLVKSLGLLKPFFDQLKNGIDSVTKQGNNHIAIAGIQRNMNVYILCTSDTIALSSILWRTKWRCSSQIKYEQIIPPIGLCASVVPLNIVVQAKICFHVVLFHKKQVGFRHLQHWQERWGQGFVPVNLNFTMSKQKQMLVKFLTER